MIHGFSDTQYNASKAWPMWDFMGLMPILAGKKIMIFDLSVDIMYQVNVKIKYLWQRYVMEAGHLHLNFIPNIRAMNRKHFTH